MTRKLPDTASVATAVEGAKLTAPAATRNAEAICDILRRVAPARGNALEIASGTGQHVVAFASTQPGLNWQPSEISSERIASINAYVSEAGLANLNPAIELNAAKSGWSEQHGKKDLIILVNLLHLITNSEVETVLREAAKALSSDGVFVLYGPFKRNGILTSDGDARFDAQLRGADPEIGYKDDGWIAAHLRSNNLNQIETVEMPANNLVFVAGRNPQ